jgi:beta-glucanase (GH16 family)
MKKFLYFCGMILLSMNVMAQIDPYDRNWDTIVYDGFSTPGRFWHHWSFCSNDGVWRAYPGFGVTNGKELQVYQFDNCHFNDNDNVMELVSEFDEKDSIPTHHYALPSWMHNNYPDNDSLFFFSGEIDYYNEQMTDYGRFKYGYFEIRCKLPIHTGAFPAFWLWYADSISPNNRYYEEIDIFEFSWSFENFPNGHNNPHPHGAGNPHCFTTGIHYSDTTNHLHWKHSKARNFPMIGDSLNHWHSFACEWLPEHVIWYCDGNIVNEYHNPDNIPQHSLTLKTNYAIDKYALHDHLFGDTLIWKSSDKMIIDYIKVYQLNWDCNTDETIAQQSDLEYFDYGVKKSIDITASIEPVHVGNTDKVTFRATNSFEITGPFQVDYGGEMTAIMQSCPE